MFSYFNTAKVGQNMQKLAYFGLLLTVYAVAAKESFWLTGEGTQLPPELQGVDLDAHPCQPLCYPPYSQAINNVIAANNKFSPMAVGVLAYCQKAVEACGSGIEACLYGIGEKDLSEFLMYLTAKAAPYFPSAPTNLGM